MKKILGLAAISLVVLTLALTYYLFRSSPFTPVPADTVCLATGPEDGQLLPTPRQPPFLYGFGKTYAKHIEETSWSFDPDAIPPIFHKHLHALTQPPASATVKYPSYRDLMNSADVSEPGLSNILADKFEQFPVLMDYEVELALILLEDIDPADFNDPSFSPKLGYAVGNDISARSMMILGQGQANDHVYYGAAKSFPGFNPLSEKMWVPNTQQVNSTLCVKLVTTVNGEVRQSQITQNQIFSPKQIVQFVGLAFPEDGLKKGSIIMSGTPAGVILKITPWIPRLTNLLGMSRFTKLSFVFDKAQEASWLKVGDTLVVSAGFLGEVSTIIIE